MRIWEHDIKDWLNRVVDEIEVFIKKAKKKVSNNR